MSTEHELRGHSWIVRCLASVPTADGRVLLASADVDGDVRVWDPQSGDPVAGPLNVDEVSVAGLGAVRLGSGTRALASLGTRQLKLWDLQGLSQAASPLWQVDVSYATALAVVPATATTPELIVASERGSVRVIDPETGRTTFQVASGQEIAGGVKCLAAGQFDDETAGFALVRYSGDVEFRVPDAAGGSGGWKRREFALDGLGSPESMAFLTGIHGDPLVAVTRGCEAAVWNLRTERRVAWAAFDVRMAVLAPVPLGDRTLLALGFTHGQDAGVHLWDPHTHRAIGGRFNRHGPAFGTPGSGGVSLHAVTCVRGPGGSVRVVSAANDGAVRVSTPFDSGVLPPAEHGQVAAEAAMDGQADAGKAEIRITGDTRVRASTVPAAIDAFADAIAATPVVERRWLQDTFEGLRKAWGARKLITGSLDEITEILRTNLERDGERPGGTYFLVDFMEHDTCTQVNSMHGGRFVPYRVWRTADGAALYSNREDLERRTDGPRRPWWRRWS